MVRELDGRVWVDDEDEFAEHQVSLGYPSDVIAAARASCDRLVALVGGGHPPYDGSAAPVVRRARPLVEEGAASRLSPLRPR